jgi:hypothetical protein
MIYQLGGKITTAWLIIPLTVNSKFFNNLRMSVNAY